MKILLDILQFLPSLAFEVLRSQVFRHVSLGIILVAFISRQRLPKYPFDPRHRTPAIPDRGLHVEWGALVYQDIIPSVFVGFLREYVQSHEVGSREGHVPED